MARIDPHVRIRLPDYLRQDLKAAAAANGRSMNAEIVARLKSSGETLRDRFAMAAVPELQRRYFHIFDRDGCDLSDADLASEAYNLADALIAAREEDS